MRDLHWMMGTVIVVICVLLLTVILASRFFRWNLPRFFSDNFNEISLLTVVSLLMGLVLILF